MKRFQSFIKESQESHVVLTLGRFNPPTNGHDLVINKVYDLAEQYNAPYHVFVSRTHDHSKNPIDPETKIAFVRECFPESYAELTTKEYPGIIQLAELVQENHTHLHVVAGQDRVQEYQTLLDKYNGGRYSYENITVYSAGQRNPTNEGIEGISASKMRQYAKEGNWDAFYWACPNHADKELCERMYHVVRAGLNIKEEKQGKALFITGGPGSGKDIIIRPLLQTDAIFEISANKLLHDGMHGNYLGLLDNRSPVIINGTFLSENEFNWCKEFLESFNYKTAMVYVYTSDEESRIRNELRQGNGRVINESVRHDKWLKSTNMTPFYHKILGENFCVFENSTAESANLQINALMNRLQEFFFGPPIDASFEQFLSELFQHGYPIVPDDQNPINRNIPTIGKKKGKSVNPKTFQGVVDRNAGAPGNGIGYDYSIRGGEGSAPAGGIGDASYRESVMYEMFNHHYPFTKDHVSTHDSHAYSFDVPHKHGGLHHYGVEINHYNGGKHAEVSFHRKHAHDDEGDTDSTHDIGHGAQHVFSTVHHIMKHHLRQHPHVTHVEFSANAEEPARKKFYHAYAKKLDPHYKHHEDGFETNFSVATHKIREEVDAVSPMYGGIGSGNMEPMVTPGEKVIDQMTSTGTNTTKKKTFRDIRKNAK